MKRTLIITLLLLVAAFSFGQTNSTFNNLDVRNTTKLRGLIYPFGAVATSPINTAVHEIAMINNTTFALCRMDFEEFADSIANYLNPIIGSHWERTGNYLYPITLSDSVGIGTDTPIERLDVQNGNINLDTTSATSGQITQNGETVFHTYTNGDYLNLFFGLNSGNFTLIPSFTDDAPNIGIGSNSLSNISTGSGNIGIGINSLSSLTESVSNIAIGTDALMAHKIGGGNISIGIGSSISDTSGTNNTIVGHEAMVSNISGGNNIAIGAYALHENLGDENIAIGVSAGYNETGSNKLYIENSNADSTGALIFGNFATDRLTFNADLVYGDTHWEDLTTSAAQAKIGANNKPVYDFDSLALKWDATDTTTNYTAHNFQLRHTYAPSTSIYPHVHYWQHTASDTCEWMILLYRWTDIGETRPAYTRIHTNNQTVRAYTSNTLHQIASFPAIVDGGTHTESSIFDCKLYVYSNGVLYTSQLDIHFEQNKPGTYNEYP